MLRIFSLSVSQNVRATCVNVYGAGVLLISATLLTGCAKNSPPVSDVDQATVLIKQTFDDWKAGASLDAQREKSPPVYVAEELWLNGTKLESYELSGPGEEFGTNVRFHVKLECAAKGSGESKSRQLKYLVTTEPACTIAREDR